MTCHWLDSYAGQRALSQGPAFAAQPHKGLNLLGVKADSFDHPAESSLVS